MKKITVLLLAFLMIAPNAFSWGDQGHATIGHIADKHLSPKAKAAIDRYLGGLSLASVASDADKYRDEWNKNYADIESFIKELKENVEGMEPNDRSVKIRLIVNWVGEMHCPMFMQKDSGVRIKLGEKGKEYSLRKFWDEGIFASLVPSMTFSDIARLADTATIEEMTGIASGDIRDYAIAAAKASLAAHEYEGKRFADYQETPVVVPSWYPAKMRPLLMQQLRNGGYRLAAIMNMIFE